jgi:3D (Asp-Asp-Asp) domain-containing protein
MFFRSFFITFVFFLISLAFISSFQNHISVTDRTTPTFIKSPNPVIATKTKFSEEVEEDKVELAFKTEYRDDNGLELGLEEIIQEGKLGMKKVVTTIIFYEGEEYERKVEEEIIKEPIDEVIARGTKIVPKTLETEYGGIIYIRKFSDFWATSYDSTCSGCSTTTATGMKQGYGVVAVDPEVISLYSKLYIPGYGIAVAGDVGGSIKGNKIDLGFDSLNGQWKAHYVDVYLLTD